MYLKKMREPVWIPYTVYMSYDLYIYIYIYIPQKGVKEKKKV